MWYFLCPSHPSHCFCWHESGVLLTGGWSVTLVGPSARCQQRQNLALPNARRGTLHPSRKKERNIFSLFSVFFFSLVFFFLFFLYFFFFSFSFLFSFQQTRRRQDRRTKNGGPTNRKKGDLPTNKRKLDHQKNKGGETTQPRMERGRPFNK